MISNEDRLEAIAIPLEWKADRLSRVPYGVFQRQDVYVREQKRLFRGRVWNYLCLEVEIPEIGDYVATYAGDTPVVVTRGHDGQIYAFENRCSHRGSLLALKDRDNVKSFTCVYHAWTYNLEGDLTGVAFKDGIGGKGGMAPTFCMEAHAPNKLRLTVLHGLIFGSFSNDVPAIEEYLGDEVLTRIERVLSGPRRLAHDRFRQRGYNVWQRRRDSAYRDTDHVVGGRVHAGGRRHRRIHQSERCSCRPAPASPGGHPRSRADGRDAGMAVGLDRDARARSRGRGFVLDAPSAGYRHAREQGDRAAERAPAAVAANAWRRRTRASRAMPARGVALDFRHVVELARRNLARVGASDRADVERPARHHVMHHAAARDALDGRRRRRSLRTDRARFRGALRPAKSTLIGDGMRRSHGQVHRQVRRADPASSRRRAARGDLANSRHGAGGSEAREYGGRRGNARGAGPVARGGVLASVPDNRVRI